MQDLSNPGYRKEILDEILNDENRIRKLESYKRREIAKNRHAPYILQRLAQEFPESYQSMRKILSINPVPRILDERAALYRETPDRQITLADGSPLSDDQQTLIDALYKFGKIDQKIKSADWIYELQDQCELQIVPANGAISLRAFHPHQVDVVKDERNPEKAFAYVISTFQNTMPAMGGDGIDEKIANRNDGQSGGDR